MWLYIITILPQLFKDKPVPWILRFTACHIKVNFLWQPVPWTPHVQWTPDWPCRASIPILKLLVCLTFLEPNTSTFNNILTWQVVTSWFADQLVTTYPVEMLLKGEVLSSTNAKRNNNLIIDVLQGQPRVHWMDYRYWV